MITPEVDTYIKYIAQKHRGANSVVYNRKQYLTSSILGGVANITSPINQDDNVICILITDLSIILPIAGNFFLTDDAQTNLNKNILCFQGCAGVPNYQVKDFNYVALGETFSLSIQDATAIFTAGYITVSKGAA